MNNSWDLTVDNDKTTTYIPNDSISIGYGAQKKYLKSEEEHDIIITKELKEKQFMSFVGFIKCKNGILAFGDTKGTRDKFYPEFENRGKIRKVFQNEHLLLTTFGNNDVGSKKLKIEKIIFELITEKNFDAFSFIEEFKKITKQNYDEREFAFLIYNKRTDTFHLIVCQGSKDNHYLIEQQLISRGVLIYQTALEELSLKRNFSDYSVNENEAFFDETFSTFVKKIDETGFYNAVGLPFIYEKYEFKEI